jgi:hypothetical protein
LWLGFDSGFDLLIALDADESVFFKNYAQYAVFKNGLLRAYPCG